MMIWDATVSFRLNESLIVMDMQLDVFASAGLATKADQPFTCDILHPIGARAIGLLNSLGAHAHFRKLLVAKLLCDFKPARAAQLAGVSESMVDHAFRDVSDKDLGELAQAYATHSHKVKIPEIEIDLIQQFIKDLCPGRSGQSREHYYQRITSDQLYTQYRQQHHEMLVEMLQSLTSEGLVHEKSAALETLVKKLKRHEQELGFLAFVRSNPAAEHAFGGGHLPGPAQIPIDYLLDQLGVPPLPVPRSRQTFEAVKDELQLTVLHRFYGQFACATCAHGVSALSDIKRLKNIDNPTAEQANELKTAEKRIQKYEWHLKVVAAQMPTVEALFKTVPADTAVVLMDFGSYRTDVNVGDKDKAPWTSLVLVVEEKELRTYVDVLVRDRAKQKGDFWFLRAALLHVLLFTDLLTKFAHLVFVTDTSSKQFRSCFEFAFFGALGKLVNKTIRLLYRAERHGHSLCDSHFGLVSQAITRFLNASEAQSMQTPSVSASLLSPLANIDTLAKLLRETFKDTDKRHYRCEVLYDVDRSDKLRPKVRAVPGTMKLHDISFQSPKELLAKQLSTDSSPDLIRLRFEKDWDLKAGSCGPGWLLQCYLIAVFCLC